MVDVFHGLTVTSWAPNLRHAALILTAKLGCSNRDINDGCINQHLFTANRAALEVFLRRRAERFVSGFRRGRLVGLATPISPSYWP